MIQVITPDPPGPYQQTHEAHMNVVSHFLGWVMGVIPLFMLVTMLAKHGMPQHDGDWFALGLYAVMGIPVGWLYAATLWRHSRGIPAGFKIKEHEDSFEVYFFTGDKRCWSHEFQYSDVLGSGTDRFHVGTGTVRMAYVRTTGQLGFKKRQPIGLWSWCDLRRLHPIYIDVIAADIARVLSRHGHPLPQPETQP